MKKRVPKKIKLKLNVKWLSLLLLFLSPSTTHATENVFVSYIFPRTLASSQALLVHFCRVSRRIHGKWREEENGERKIKTLNENNTVKSYVQLHVLLRLVAVFVDFDISPRSVRRACDAIDSCTITFFFESWAFIPLFHPMPCCDWLECNSSARCPFIQVSFGVVVEVVAFIPTSCSSSVQAGLTVRGCLWKNIKTKNNNVMKICTTLRALVTYIHRQFAGYIFRKQQRQKIMSRQCSFFSLLEFYEGIALVKQPEPCPTKSKIFTNLCRWKPWDLWNPIPRKAMAVKLMTLGLESPKGWGQKRRRVASPFSRTKKFSGKKNVPSVGMIVIDFRRFVLFI